MTPCEKEAMRTLHTKLIELEPSHIAPYLYENKILDDNQLLEIIETQGKVVSSLRAQKFLLLMKENCPMQVFLSALRYQHSYPFLAEAIETELGISNDDEVKERINYEPQRIQPNGPERKKLIRFAHYLKRLHHSGNQTEFNRVTKTMNKYWKRSTLNRSVSVSQRQSLADHLYYSLDARLGNIKIKPETGSTINTEQVIITGIKDVLPFTTNPTVCSMNFLARHASVIADRDSPDQGLAMLDYSKAQTQLVQPCKESGMVLYIEHNILSKKFQNVDYPWIKDRMIQCAKEGIYHFKQESEDVGNDFEAMLLLKIAFCHLGLDTAGKKYKHYTPAKSDLKSSKSCLDRVEEMLWTYLDNRRKMFYFVGRAVLSDYDKKRTLAVMYSRQAKEEASEGKFKELPVISELVSQAVERQLTTTIELPLTEDELLKQFKDAGFDSLSSEESEVGPDRDIDISQEHEASHLQDFARKSNIPLSSQVSDEMRESRISFETCKGDDIIPNSNQTRGSAGVDVLNSSTSPLDGEDQKIQNEKRQTRPCCQHKQFNSDLNREQLGNELLASDVHKGLNSDDNSCLSNDCPCKGNWQGMSMKMRNQATESAETSSLMNIHGGIEFHSNGTESSITKECLHKKESIRDREALNVCAVEHFESNSLMNIRGGVELPSIASCPMSSEKRSIGKPSACDTMTPEVSAVENRESNSFMNVQGGLEFPSVSDSGRFDEHPQKSSKGCLKKDVSNIQHTDVLMNDTTGRHDSSASNSLGAENPGRLPQRHGVENSESSGDEETETELSLMQTLPEVVNSVSGYFKSLFK